MYCPINNSDSDNCICTTRCCRLYNIALAFLGAILFFVLGIIFSLVASDLVAGALPLLIVTFVLIFIVFIVTVLTRGCCNNSLRE
ncbi:MAG: hypothetical protein K5768_01840 [Firmicutes bacterium]|nr:hypothetical protein [Bacillota bacterium]